MGNHIVIVKAVHMLNHDVVNIVTEKPIDYTFIPGQATDVAINKEGWRDQKRPFTFTNLPGDNFFEFTIKTYPEKKGVTGELLNLKQDDSLILHDVFGAIAYKGKGVFIAGGAGITPFIAIFRDLNSRNKVSNNMLIYSNKTEADIILKQEFYNLLGDNFINILSEEKSEKYANGRITEEFLKKHIGDSNKRYYLCGPPPMMEAVMEILTKSGVDENSITKENI